MTTARRRTTAARATVTLALAGATLTVPAEAHTTGIHDNCTEFNEKWPHGVGRRGAHDQTSGTPATTFKRNTKAYKKAVRHNSTLDRDNDGIDCEKA